MRKRTAVILAAAMLCAVLAVGIFAASSDNVPSLFYNDEAWHKDEMAPALFRDGRFYIPGDFLVMFDYISFTAVGDGENLLLTNSETGDYISVLCSTQAACVNGEILENIGVFRENRYYYLDAEFVAEHLGLYVEYSDAEEPGERSVRIYDNTCMMAFAELLTDYAGGQAEETDRSDELFSEETEPIPSVPGTRSTRIFLVCRESDEGDVVSAWSTADRLGFACSVFLTSGSDRLREVDMNGSVGLSVTSAEDAEAINEVLASLFCRKTHLVLSTGDDDEDKNLSKAGYYILKPDFEVDGTTDASVVLRNIEEYGESHDYITVLLGNVWQSETLLLLLAELDGNEYEIGAIPGFN